MLRLYDALYGLAYLFAQAFILSLKIEQRNAFTRRLGLEISGFGNDAFSFASRGPGIAAPKAERFFRMLKARGFKWAHEPVVRKCRRRRDPFPLPFRNRSDDSSAGSNNSRRRAR